MSLNDHGWGNGPRSGNQPDGDDGKKDQPSQPGAGGSGGGNDPNGNRQPPDLDEIWRDLNRRLNELLGRKQSTSGSNNTEGGGPQGPRPGRDFSPLSSRQFGGGLGIVVGVVAAVWLFTGFYVVDAGERGVVSQFGRFKEMSEPGLRWRMPWPIESHQVVNSSEVRTLEIGFGSERDRARAPKDALMLTDDENIVSVQFAVQYMVKDPVAYLFNNRINNDDVVKQAAETAIREVVGKNRMDYVLYEGRDVIAANTQSLIQEILDRYDAGVQIRSVTMQSTQPPEQVQAAFDDAVKAGQDRERQKNEGQAYANDVIPRAEGTSARLREEAIAYRAKIVATAEGDASRFTQVLGEYSKAPEVMRTRLYLETLQQIYANTSKVMVDAKGQGNLLYLPLDKLAQAAASAQAAQAAQASNPGDNTAATGSRPGGGSDSSPADKSASDRTEYRGRESVRNRDGGDR